MNVRTLLSEEIQDEFQHLNKMEVGTETYKTTVDGLTKLVDRAIELEKIDNEKSEKEVIRDVDYDFKLKQIVDDRKDKMVRNAIAVAGIVIPSVITIWGTVKSFEFEKEGTITTIMGRGFINKLLPKK